MIFTRFFIGLYSFVKKNRDILLYIFGAITVILGIVTYYLVVYKRTIETVNLNFTVGLALFDLTSILIFVILLTTKILEIRKKHNSKSLQNEIIMMFSIITAIPTILICIFSIYFFIFGIQSWFNEKVTSMLDLSVKVGESYVKEHNLHIKNTALFFADELNRRNYELAQDKELLQKLLDAYSNIRELDEAIIFKGSSGEIFAQSRFAYSFIFSPYPKEHIDRASLDQVVILPTKKDRIRLLIKLREFDDTYLVIGRMIDDKIIEYIDESSGVAVNFNDVKNKIGSLQVKFIFIFILVSVLLLLISINIGIIFANKILNPINVLVNAIKAVKQGDLSTRIKNSSDNNEMTLLSKGFNEMVTSIDEHRKDLLLVQKSLAWTDVARRVAHEIKNPLTPMQLAADRLKSKFGTQIYQDKEKFDRYIDTIVRHIDDISKIVFNFVNFVKMPKSNYQQCNFVELIKDLVDSRKILHEDIQYEFYSNTDIIDFNCDKNQFNQVFVNLFQNSEEALSNIADKKISIILRKLDNEFAIIISDNGLGFTDKLLNKAIEPYVTTKPNGTGLGLSIVDRIISDHGGILELSNNIDGGASILMKFSL